MIKKLLRNEKMQMKDLKQVQEQQVHVAQRFFKSELSLI